MSAVTILVLSQKGGVAKTSSAVHLAALLSQTHRTLLIDGDDRGYATDWAQAVGLEVDGPGGMMRRGEYEALVIDTMADPSERDAVSLGKNSTHILLPSTPEPQAIKGLAGMVRVLDAGGIPRERMHVLLVRDRRVGTAAQDAREVLEASGLRVLSTTIRETADMGHASAQRLVHQGSLTSGKMAWEDYRRALKELLA